MSDKAGKPRSRQDTDELRLRAEARLHDNVVPVPFLATTWRERGPAYWRRRVGTVAVFLFLLLIVGGVAAGFAAGILGGAHGPVRVVLVVVYCLLVVLGFVTGRRQVARMPYDPAHAAPRTAVPSGCLAFVFAPFGLGLCLAVLASLFGRRFPGEERARRLTESLRR